MPPAPAACPRAIPFRLRACRPLLVAHLLPDDDARARLKSLPRLNSAAVQAFGTNLLTIRIELD